MSAHIRQIILFTFVLFSISTCRSIVCRTHLQLNPRVQQNNTTTTTNNTSVPVPQSTGTSLSGVNIAGLEFGVGNDGGLNGSPLQKPDVSQLQHYLKEGMKIFRIQFAWQRLQVRSTLSSFFFIIFLDLSLSLFFFVDQKILNAKTN